MKWRPRITTCLAAGLCLTAFGGGYPTAPPMGPPAPPAQPISSLPTAADLCLMALADLRTIPPFHRQYIRYLSVQDADMRSVRTCSLTMQYLSRASVIQLPLPVAGNHLVRIDLRHYAPREGDLIEWLKFWEELSFDPTYSLLITRDTIRFAGLTEEQLPRRKVQRTTTRKVPGGTRREKRVVTHRGGDFVYPSGSDYAGKTAANLPPGEYSFPVTVTEAEREVAETSFVEVSGLGEGVDVVRLDAPHLPPEAVQELQSMTGSLAPVVDHRYFKVRALTTIRDKGVFAAIWGGLYYDFRGVRKGKAGDKATDLDRFFEQLGIGNIRGGESADQLFGRLRSDQRLAVFRSKVAGKPRDVSMFHTPAEREGGSWGAITGDVKDQDVDIGDRAFANLLTPRRQAREAIFPTAAGFPIYALFNGVGARQDEVPPDVAIDDTIPAPYTRRLQPAIGCIRCHGPHDGWQPLVNDVKSLLAGNRFDIYGDIGAGRSAFDPDTIDRLAGLYAGDFSKNLRRARDDFAEAVLRATGPWPDGGDKSQADAARVAAARLSEEYGSYQYDLVYARDALQELGIVVQDRDEAVQLLKRLLPPDPRSAVAPGLIPEDPRLAALMSGIGILRSDWELAHSFAAERVQKTIAARRERIRRINAN